MRSEIKFCKTDISQIKKMWNQNSSKSVLQIFLKKFGFKHNSSLKINCENFIMSCTVGFRAILDQRLAFTVLDENWTAHAFYLCARSCDAMYRVRESKSKFRPHGTVSSPLDPWCPIFWDMRRVLSFGKLLFLGIRGLNSLMFTFKLTQANCFKIATKCRADGTKRSSWQSFFPVKSIVSKEEERIKLPIKTWKK